MPPFHKHIRQHVNQAQGFIALILPKYFVQLDTVAYELAIVLVGTNILQLFVLSKTIASPNAGGVAALHVIESKLLQL